jgi:hypothetical protein
VLPAVEPVRVLKPSSDISGNAFYTETEVSLTFTSKTLSIWASVTSASVCERSPGTATVLRAMVVAAAFSSASRQRMM